MFITNIFQKVGKSTINSVREIGQVTRLLLSIFRYFPQIIKSRKLVFYQMEHIGVNSIPLVIIIATFTGAVAAWQAAYQGEPREHDTACYLERRGGGAVRLHRLRGEARG